MKSHCQTHGKCRHAKRYLIAMELEMGKASDVLYRTLIIGTPKVHISIQLGAQVRIPLGTHGHLSQ